MSDAALHPVRVGACRCPGAPHADGDIVYLAPALSLTGGIAASAALSIGGSPQAIYQAVALACVEHGVVDWTFVDADGHKLPIDAATIRGALPWAQGGAEVTKLALELYGEGILSPFSGPSTTGRRATKKTRTSSSSSAGSTATSST